ncbi:hypothetical protein DITRI_Ditri17bG0037200 [Diplodiscus trichospermus]
MYPMPLKRGTKVAVPGLGKRLVIFRYEQLPDYCYMCGCLSHHEPECDMVVQMKRATGKVVREFVQWLKAEISGEGVFSFDGRLLSTSNDLSHVNEVGIRREHRDFLHTAIQDGKVVTGSSSHIGGEAVGESRERQ